MVNTTTISSDTQRGHDQSDVTHRNNWRGARLNNVGDLTRLDRILAFTILFISAWNFCLPVAGHVDLPWWVAKIQFLPRLYINEALFIVYLVLVSFRRVQRLILRLKYPNSLACTCMIVLAVWCAVISTFGPLPLHDLGRSGRLILMALLLIAATQWAAHEPLYFLRAFLIGLIAGTIVNLFYTFAHPYIIVGALPRLLGQNTPGPAMGIGVCLSAWLLLLSRKRIDVFIAFWGTVICGSGALISYSKIGLFACFAGFLCLTAVALKALWIRKSHLMFYFIVLLTIVSFIYSMSENSQVFYCSLKQMIVEKLNFMDSSKHKSTQIRMKYVVGVGEILLSHPVGVGFSGFKEAMMITDAYHSGQAADESAINPADSNPHAFILYYASAGGFIGGTLSLAAFMLLWHMMHRGMRAYGLAGIAVANLTGMAYLVMAISVPYLLNSAIMIIPAAVAGGLLIRSGGRTGKLGRLIETN